MIDEALPEVEIPLPPPEYVAFPYVAFDLATGAIVMTGITDRALAPHLPEMIPPGCALLEGNGSMNLHYVVDGEIRGKAPMPGRVDEQTISWLPIPCRLTISGVTHEVTDGTAVLDLPFPGAYQVFARAVPFLDRVFEVTREDQS